MEFNMSERESKYIEVAKILAPNGPATGAGAIDAVMAAANAREQQAVAQYTQTVQNAFRDVHDALNNVAATAASASNWLRGGR